MKNMILSVLLIIVAGIFYLTDQISGIIFLVFIFFAIMVAWFELIIMPKIKRGWSEQCPACRRKTPEGDRHTMLITNDKVFWVCGDCRLNPAAISTTNVGCQLNSLWRSNEDVLAVIKMLKDLKKND